jgi:signal transduction histidine kinase
MTGPLRLVSIAPSPLSPVVRFLSRTWPIGVLAAVLAAFGGLVAAPCATPDRLVLLFLANLLVLWLARIPLRKQRNAFAQLSRSTAALEDRLREGASQLARTNHELEAIQEDLDLFSHSLSHDLRAPLRGILSYTTTVIEDDGKHLSAESKAYLEFSIQAAHRGNKLIDGFLELTRSAGKSLDKTPFDLARMASCAIETFRNQDPSRVVAYLGPESAKVFGDRCLLRKVLEILLSNAWECTRGTPDARIEFAVAEEDAGTVFAIRDNGIGFDANLVDRLFRNRSDHRIDREAEGYGMGLSNAQRILDRHGGWLKARGTPGEGAEFRFWLPPGPAAPA